MNRREFMTRLEELLADIPQEERSEALAYYNGYFEDAGEENEESIINELESPEKVAGIIKADVGSEQDKEYSETGYQDQRFTQWQEVGSRVDAKEEKRQEQTYYTPPKQENGSDKTLKTVLIVIVAILTSPIWLGLLGGLCGLIFGLIGLALGGAAVVIALLVTGVVLGGVGIGMICGGVFGLGLGLLGSGLILLAIALLGLIAAVWVFGRFLPWLVKGIVSLCGRLFQNRGNAV